MINFKGYNDKVIIGISNNYYNSHSQAIGRTLRILSRYVPLKYKVFEINLSEHGLPISKIEIFRQDIVDVIDAPNAEAVSLKLSQISPSYKTIEDVKVSTTEYNSFDWSIRIRKVSKINFFTKREWF